MVIDVVAAIITKDDGKILIAQRNLKKSQGGLWEFPGGKIEKNETKEHAIEREIKEELSLDIKAQKEIGSKIFNYPEKDINLIAIKCDKISENIILNEHENYAWIDINEADKYNFAPADIFILDLLKKQV